MKHRILVVGGIAFLSTFAASCASYPPLSPVAAAVPGGVALIEEQHRYWLVPEQNGSDMGLIFYPGGRVEPEAYVSMLAPVAAAGFTVVIERMPLDLAVTAPNRAADVVDRGRARLAGVDDDQADTVAGRDGGLPVVRRWAIGGHSLGGAMAARFLVRNGEEYPEVMALVLLAAYPPGSDSLAGSRYPVLSIWASEDGLSTSADEAETAHLLPENAIVVVIEGGNHAGFGEYGPQDGDGERTISLADQHRQIQELVIDFLRSL